MPLTGGFTIDTGVIWAFDPLVKSLMDLEMAAQPQSSNSVQNKEHNGHDEKYKYIDVW